MKIPKVTAHHDHVVDDLAETERRLSVTPYMNKADCTSSKDTASKDIHEQNEYFFTSSNTLSKNNLGTSHKEEVEGKC